MENDVALVLGGGGSTGNAWQVGVLTGLADAGVDLTDADLVIGTSAGATTAVQVRSTVPLPELYAATLQAPPTTRPGGVRPPGMSAVFDRMRAIGAQATSAAELRAAMGAWALEADAGFDADAAERRRRLVAGRLPMTDWPAAGLRIVAVEAESGEVVTFDRHSGVTLVDAVVASTSAPGVGPTREINGHHYIDGGVHSVDNAELAAGFARVIVVSPLGTAGESSRAPGAFEGIRRQDEWGTTLRSQLDALAADGSAVVLIAPDEAARAAMGANLMDLSARPAAARAGFEQGRAVAAELRELLR